VSLPVFFIVLASATLLAALAALFASLRAAFGGASAEPLAAGPGLPDRAALEDEKNALLRALKDLEYEHEVGKIADADYERLEHAYRNRAKQVLADLDRDLGPYLSQAEALVSRTLGEAKASEARSNKKAKKRARADAETSTKDELPASDDAATVAKAPEVDEPAEEPSPEPVPAAPRTTEPVATLVCAKCETKNDPDASFCKRCASPLGAGPEASV
jgi:hypothetical protein